MLFVAQEARPLCASVSLISVGGTWAQHWSLGSQAVSSVCPLGVWEGSLCERKQGKVPRLPPGCPQGSGPLQGHTKELSVMKTP